jgi:hypothetical protein
MTLFEASGAIMVVAGLLALSDAGFEYEDQKENMGMVVAGSWQRVQQLPG